MLSMDHGVALEPGGKLRILLVGDIDRLLDLDRTVLRRNEIRLLTAPPDPETLNLAQREPLSLIVIEIGEDSRPGLEMCRNLRSLPITEDIPVILIAGPQAADEATRCGADAVLRKPLSQHEFLEAIGRHARLRERQHRRYPVNLRFAFSGGAKAGQAFSRVVSIGGAFLKTDVPMPRNTRLQLRFHLPGDDVEIRCAGVVRNTAGWVDASDHTPGFGVEFEDLRRGDAARLRAFIDELERRLNHG